MIEGGLTNSNCVMVASWVTGFFRSQPTWEWCANKEAETTRIPAANPAALRWIVIVPLQTASGFNMALVLLPAVPILAHTLPLPKLPESPVRASSPQYADGSF